MNHYTIGYHDTQYIHHEICEYAEDAYTAIKQARRDLKGFDNPHAAEYCIREDWSRTCINKIVSNTA